MLRSAYVLLLRLHPRPFRRRYAEEMLWIFDATAGLRTQSRLFVDVLVSLGRQWALRPRYRREPGSQELAGRTAAGAPVFFTFESSMPRPSSLLNGFVLSMAVFGAAAFLISHGEPTGLMKLPRVELPSRDISPGLIVETASAPVAVEAGGEMPGARPPQAAFPLPAGAATVTTSPGPVSEQSREVLPGHFSPPRRALPDTPTLSAIPQRRPLSGKSRGELATNQAARLMERLDRDGDGRISQDEASAVQGELREFLSLADLNQDGFVVLDELRTALRADAAEH